MTLFISKNKSRGDGFCIPAEFSGDKTFFYFLGTRMKINTVRFCQHYKIKDRTIN